MFWLILLETAWWVLLLEVAALGILMAITVYERPLSGLVWFLAAFVGLSFLQGINPFTWAATNGGTILSYLLVYLLIGVVFAYVKWTWFYLTSDAVKDKISTSFELFQT